MDQKTKRLIGALMAKRPLQSKATQIPNGILNEARAMLIDQAEDISELKAALAEANNPPPPQPGDFPGHICGFPLPGWKLDHIGPTAEAGFPRGWTVTLRRERTGPEDQNWPTDRVEARSDVGPLEAWDEVLRMARRDDQRRAGDTSHV